MAETTKGNSSAHQLITHAESLLLALDAVTRALDETLPHALDRMASLERTTESAAATMKPMHTASELVTQPTRSHVNTGKRSDERGEGKGVSVRFDLSDI